MIELVKAHWKQLRDGKPGRRFRDYHEFRRRNRESAATRIVIIVVGLILIIGGLSISWLPGPGGFIAIFGVALLAQEFPHLAGALDRAELLVRRIWKWFTDLSTVAKACVILICLAVTGGAMYLGYTWLLA